MDELRVTGNYGSAFVAQFAPADAVQMEVESRLIRVWPRVGDQAKPGVGDALLACQFGRDNGWRRLDPDRSIGVDLGANAAQLFSA
jgi:hypothetical protein